MSARSVLVRIAAIAGVTVAVATVSTTTADAHPAFAHGHGYRSGARYGCVRVAPVVVRPYGFGGVVVPVPFWAPRSVVVAPPLPDARVVYDRFHVPVGGFIGVTGRHLGIGVSF